MWSWAETFLRFHQLSKSRKINKSIIFKTENLYYPKKVEELLRSLNVEFNKIKNIKKINTNEDIGFQKTNVCNVDLLTLKKFIFKIPKMHNSVIYQLELCLEKHQKLLG